MKPTISIEYCPKCGWMLRAAYMAQELLTTFADDVHGVLLQPSEISGSYIIGIDGKEVFNRKQSGRFPEIRN
jgi:selenoprotein W-related protein